MTRRSSTNAERLQAALDALNTDDVTALRDQFHALYGINPPARWSLTLLRLATAYRLQANALGGLKSSVRRALLDDSFQHCPKPSLRPGALLVREWQGISHTVTVLDQGFRYGGGTYRSLSEIARYITGQRRSGPQFFGVNSDG
jgi:hypothetical protein